jgi:AraC family transcriptional regulator
MDAPLPDRTATLARTSSVAAASYQGATALPRHTRNSPLEIEPARGTVPLPEVTQLRHPPAALRATITAVDAELTSGGLGEPLAAESLVNVMAEHLLRYAPFPQEPARSRRNDLPCAKLRAVLEYVEEHLDARPTLQEMAAVARLSPTYFAWQFKRAMGLPPHRYIIGRRIARAKQILESYRDIALAQVALQAGFCDQSQFSNHFKRFIGVTPGKFRRRSIER